MKKLVYGVLIFILVLTISASAEKNLKLTGWSFQVDAVNENLKEFESQYGIKTDDYYNFPSLQFHDKLVASFISGTQYDVVYVRDQWLGEWVSAGWLQPLDDFEGIEQCKEDIPQGALDQMSFEGKLYGLPYYAGRAVFAYNKEHLKKAGIDSFPKTWDELLEQAKILKEKGISEHPIILSMNKSQDIMKTLEQLVFARGGRLFDKNNDPIFNKGKSVAFKSIEWAKDAIKEGLLDQASLNSTDHEVVRAMAAGTRTFTLVSDYNLCSLNDPESSKTAGNIKMALVPGNDKVRSGTTSYIRFYSIPKNCKQKENAWKLIKFLGGKDKNGEYYVMKKWALNFGLGFVQKSLYDDKEIKESIEKWGDPEVIRMQDVYAVPTPYRFTPWFGEWQTYAWGEIQKAIMGSEPTEIVLDKLAEKAKKLKATY